MKIIYSGFKDILLILLILVFSLLFFQKSYSQVTKTFTSSGTIKIPAGVSIVQVEAWGGGAGGWGNIGGGGGGAFAGNNAVLVTAGNTYSITVGNGGNAGKPGGNSSFAGLVVAEGGGNGIDITNGGRVANSIGAAGLVWPGGNGVVGTGKGGGGGGGSAGAGGAGGDGNNTGSNTGGLGGSAGIAGTGTSGATGGKGGNKGKSGSSGNTPGGGGGERGGSGSSGRGGKGKVIVTYYYTPTITSFTPTNGCANSTPVVITGTNFISAYAVTFGGVNASSFTINSSTKITATPAAGATGKVSITTLGGTVTSTANFTVNTSANAILSGTSNICNGSTATLSLSVNGTGTISGTLSDGSPFSGTAPTINVSVSPISTTTYTITTLTNGTCPSSAADKTGSATITVNTIPKGALSGTKSICKGSSAALTLAVTGSGTISGTLSDGTTFSGTAPTITVNVSPVSTTTYTIATLTNGSCTSGAANKTGSATVTVTSPSATISYPGSPFCSNTGVATITFSGTAGGTYSSLPSGASINSNNGTVNLVGSAPGSYTVTYTVPAMGGCSIYTTTAQIVINPNTWKGKNNSNWNTAGNWAAAPSSACPDFTILAGVPFEPILTSGTITIQNLIIKSGASVTLKNATLQISGTINNSGIFDASNGTVEMNGKTSQTIPANTFKNNALNNLIISNTNATGVVLGGLLDIYGSLTYNGTGKVLNTNDNLTLKSTASNTAWVGNITGNSILGKVTVERYISPRKAWRFLSIPNNTTQTIKQTWQEGCGANLSCIANYGTQITGSGGVAAGFDVYSSKPSMKTYDPIANTWVGIPNTNATSFKATDGYMVFIRGDRTANAFNSTPTQTVLRTKGNIHVGDQPPVTVGAGMFAAIGNPYPSALDMRNITKTGLKDFFYVWDPKLAGSYGYGAYQTFSNSGGNYIIIPGGGSYGAIGSISNYIQSGQAFFVQATGTGGSLTFKENAKANGSSLVTVAASMPQPQLSVNLFGVNTNGSTYMADGFLVNYGDNYNNSVNDMDALKLPNTSENLASKRNNTLLVVERRHTILQQDTIFFNLTNVKAQQYRFNFTTNQLYQPGLKGFLLDAYLKTSTPLSIDGNTTVNFNIVNVPGSYAANRFMIVFSQPAGTLPVTFTSVKVYRQQSNVNVEWKVNNESSIKQYEVEKSIDGNQFKSIELIPANNNKGGSSSYIITDTNPIEGYNYYRIKSVDINGATARTNVVKVLISKIWQKITVYPNPVINGKINLVLNSQPTGKYNIRIFNKSGRLIKESELQHTEGNSTEIIQLGNYTSHGIYQMEVMLPDGSSKNINVVN